jgi:hypothetical protein
VRQFILEFILELGRCIVNACQYVNVVIVGDAQRLGKCVHQQLHGDGSAEASRRGG